MKKAKQKKMFILTIVFTLLFSTTIFASGIETKGISGNEDYYYPEIEALTATTAQVKSQKQNIGGTEDIKIYLTSDSSVSNLLQESYLYKTIPSKDIDLYYDGHYIIIPIDGLTPDTIYSYGFIASGTQFYSDGNIKFKTPKEGEEPKPTPIVIDDKYYVKPLAITKYSAQVYTYEKTDNYDKPVSMAIYYSTEPLNENNRGEIFRGQDQALMPGTTYYIQGQIGDINQLTRTPVISFTTVSENAPEGVTLTPITILKNQITIKMNLSMWQTDGDHIYYSTEPITEKNPGTEVEIKSGGLDYYGRLCTVSVMDLKENTTYYFQGKTTYRGKTYTNDLEIATSNSETQQMFENVSGNPIRDINNLNYLKQNNATKDIVLLGSGYQYTFKKGTMIRPATNGIDFSLIVGGTPIQNPEKALPSTEKPIRQIHFNHHGDLLGSAEIKIYIGADLANRNLNYYRFNTSTNKYEKINENLIVDANGYITTNQDRCSDYIFTESTVKTDHVLITSAYGITSSRCTLGIETNSINAITKFAYLSKEPIKNIGNTEKITNLNTEISIEPNTQYYVIGGILADDGKEYLSSEISFESLETNESVFFAYPEYISANSITVGMNTTISSPQESYDDRILYSTEPITKENPGTEAIFRKGDLGYYGRYSGGSLTGLTPDTAYYICVKTKSNNTITLSDQIIVKTLKENEIAERHINVQYQKNISNSNLKRLNTYDNLVVDANDYQYFFNKGKLADIDFGQHNFNVEINGNYIQNVEKFNPIKTLHFNDLEIAKLADKFSISENTSKVINNGYNSNTQKIEVIDSELVPVDGKLSLKIGNYVDHVLTSNQIAFPIFDKKNGYVDKIKDKTMISDIIGALKSNVPSAVYEAYDVNNVVIKNHNQYITTGMYIEETLGTIRLKLPVVVRGDINQDGLITLSDVIIIRNHVLDTGTERTDIQIKAMDYTVDGIVSISDFIKTRNKVLDIE